MESLKDRQLYKHFDFLDDSALCHQQKKSGLDHSRKKQKNLESPLPRSLIYSFKQVMAPVSVHPRLLPIQLQGLRRT